MTPAPARLAIEHATQRLTTTARTESLLRHARTHRKQHVAARTLTGLADIIFSRASRALALARLGLLQLRRVLNHLLFDPTQRRLPARCLLLSLPLPVAARLLPTPRLPRRAGTVGSATLPATPVPGALAACFAAITLLGVTRAERLLTVLEETAPLPVGKCFLSPSRWGPILRWSHGRESLPGSSLGGELPLDSETPLLAHHAAFSITT